MHESTGISVRSVSLYLLPVETRVPLKFGSETLTSVTCARVRLEVSDGRGRVAEGWGETPLSVQWAWPSALSYSERHEVMKRFCRMLAAAWVDFSEAGHPIDVGVDFQQQVLPGLLDALQHLRA